MHARRLHTLVLPLFFAVCSLAVTFTPAQAISCQAAVSVSTDADPRLSQKLSVSVANIPFADLCASLQRKTGVLLSAAPDLAEDKVSLFCKERSLADILQAIGHLFDFEWRRDRASPGCSYTLFQPEEARIKEARLRERDRNSVLALLDRQMEPYRPYVGLTIAQLDALMETATGEEKRRIRYFRHVMLGPATVFMMLPHGGREALLRGQELRFTSTADAPWRLPGNVVDALVDEAKDARVQKTAVGFNMSRGPGAPGSPVVDMPDVSSFVAIWLKGGQSGTYTLHYQQGLTVPSLHLSNLGTSGDRFLQPGRQLHPSNAELNAALAKLSEMQRPITVRLEPTGEIPANTHSDLLMTGPGPVVREADLAEAFHKGTGRDVLADSFAGAFWVAPLRAEGKPLFDVLNRDGDGIGVHWDLQDGFLRFRSFTYYQQRPAEISNRLWESWAAHRKQQGALPAEDVAQIAQLPAEQLFSSANAAGAIAFYGLTEWIHLTDERLYPHFHFLAALSPDQRAQALSPEGLSFRRLPLKVQPDFLALAFNAPPSRAPGSIDTAHASYRVLFRQAPWSVRFAYAWRDPQGRSWARIVGPAGFRIVEPGEKE